MSRIGPSQPKSSILNVDSRKYGLEGLSKTAAANLSANIVSTLQAGCFVGAIAASPISDKWGRKIALLVAAAVAAVGAIMQTAANGHLAAMYVGRYALNLLKGFSNDQDEA